MKTRPEVKWATLEGVDILTIDGFDIAAIPNSGKKSSRAFTIFSLAKRTEICQVRAERVESWLIARYDAEQDKEPELFEEKPTFVDNQIKLFVGLS